MNMQSACNPWDYEKFQCSQPSPLLAKLKWKLECNLGFNMSKIISFLSLESPISRTAIRADHKFQVSENGSLVVLGVEKTGNFTCEASNGVGNGIQKSVLVVVIGKWEEVMVWIMYSFKRGGREMWFSQVGRGKSFIFNKINWERWWAGNCCNSRLTEFGRIWDRGFIGSWEKTH